MTATPLMVQAIPRMLLKITRDRQDSEQWACVRACSQQLPFLARGL